MPRSSQRMTKPLAKAPRIASEPRTAPSPRMLTLGESGPLVERKAPEPLVWAAKYVTWEVPIADGKLEWEDEELIEYRLREVRSLPYPFEGKIIPADIDP